MTTRLTTYLLLTVVMFVAAPARAGQESDGAPAALVEEVRALRLELVEERIDRLQARIAKLERSVARLRANRERADEGRRALDEELARIDERLGEPTLSDEERVGLEAARRELAETALSRAGAEREVLSRREDDLARRLDSERRSLRKLLDRREALTATRP